MAAKKRRDNDRIKDKDFDTAQDQLSRSEATYNSGGMPGPYSPGTNTGGEGSAAEITGGGAGGDIDNPDITGRGSIEDLTNQPPRHPRIAPQPQTKKES